MFAIVILAPTLVLGVIAWGVVGVLRQRGREEFTQATAAVLYAQVMVVAGLLGTLVGASVLIKVLLSLIEPSYSYFVPQEVPSGGFAQLSIHALLVRLLASMRGGSPAWIVRGTPIVLTVLTGLAGLLSAIFAGYSVLVYFIVSSQNAAFGDPAGSAAVFVPAWLVMVALLVRRLHRIPVPPPSAMAAT